MYSGEARTGNHLTETYACQLVAGSQKRLRGFGKLSGVRLRLFMVTLSFGCFLSLGSSTGSFGSHMEDASNAALDTFYDFYVVNS